MSFYGSSFSYDGISCEEYGLMLYDFNNVSQGDSAYAKGFSIEEDRIPRRHRSIYYGSYYKNPLEFTLVFGVGQRASSNREPIDRQLMEVVAMWLTGKDGYKKLSIDQPDMRDYFYNCMMTDLKTIEYAGDKWAFTCKVVCDSPYAYTYEEVFTIDSSSTADAEEILYSRSSCNEPYYPKRVTIRRRSGSEISILINDTSTEFFNLSDKDAEINIFCDTGVVTSSSGLNAYSNFNFVFPKLLPGDNLVKIVGDCEVEFVCEFPVNIGG